MQNVSSLGIQKDKGGRRCSTVSANDRGRQGNRQEEVFWQQNSVAILTLLLSAVRHWEN